MTKSRIIRFHVTGGPEVLRLETIDVPVPAEGEVRLRMTAIGLNRADILLRAGRYGGQAGTLPSPIGREGAGVVEDVGPGVSGFAIGDAVTILPGVGELPFGTYADRIIAPAFAIVPQPPTLSAVQAAALWATHLTAYAPLVEIAKVRSGDVVLLPAASSGVGVAAIGIVRALGGLPVALTRNPAKAARLLALGAAEVIVTSEEDIVARVRSITDGAGAQLAFDPVAGPGIVTLLDALAVDGILVQYGNLSGEATPLPPSVLIRNLTIVGYALDVGRNVERRSRAVRFIAEHVGKGTLGPVVSSTFPLEQAAVAHAKMEMNDHVGKIVLTTSETDVL